MCNFRVCVFCLTICAVIFCSCECKNDTSKLKFEKRKKRERFNLERNKVKSNIKRKLEGEEEAASSTEAVGRYNTSFVPLNISIDLNNFNNNLPSSLTEYKDIFIQAMMKAKAILEDLLYIEIDYDEKIILGKYFFDQNNIEFFDIKINNSKLYPYNYHIFFNFDEDDGVYSEIIAGIVYVPIIGLITIGETAIKNNQLNLEYLTNFMLHHFIHLLGFFDFESSEFEGIIKDLDEGYTINETYGPTVINYARKYFNCPDISKIILESDENDNIVWPSYLLLGELMTKFNYPEEQILSGFTLAFLDDLPYLRVVKSYTGSLMKFGKNKGCEFFNNDCLTELDSSDITFANEFNLATSSPKYSCSSGRLSKTVYKSSSGHPLSTQYCSISEYDEDDTENIYIGHCNKEESADEDDTLNESFTDSSFCVLSSLKRETESDGIFKAVCHEMICSTASLTIKIGDRYIVCPRSGGKIKVKDFAGYLLCPDYNLICSSTFLCNDHFNCYAKKSEEKENTFTYNYTIKTTQNADDYDNDANIEDPTESQSWELTNNGTCPYLCMQCDENFKCIQCAPTYKIYNEEENICLEVVPNCASYDEGDEICAECKEGYFLAELSNGTKICEILSNQNKYYKPIGSSTYKKCSDSLESCEECQEEEIELEKKVICSECIANYELIDDGIMCGDPSSQLYYLIGDKYISCINSPLIDNCLKCKMEDNEFECILCKENYYLYHSSEDSMSCIDSTDNTMYSTDGYNYYPCLKSLAHCNKCEGNNKCIECDANYRIEESNICISQEDIDNELYYSDSDQEGKYVSCSKIPITNCQKCTSNSVCTGCNNENYVLVDEGTICGEKNSQLYYLDSGEEKYKSCIKYALMPNCLKCEFTTVFNCLECAENYAFVHENDGTVTCTEITSLSINKYFTSDFKNYYPCDSSQHDINNCDTCNTKDKCLTCKTGFTTANGNTKCIPDSDISEKKYYEDPDNSNYYYLCSTSLSNCITCQNKDECLSCETEYIIEEASNHCISKTLYDEKKYYKNVATGKYVSCSNISGCEKCISATKCILCSSNLFLVKEDENIDSLTCKDTNENQYYQVTEDDITFYKKCTISSNQFCEKCELVDGNYVCLKCKEGYAFFFDGSGENICESKEARADIDNYYSTDNQNYYPCNNRQYNVIDNCIKCSNKETCDECNSGYTLVNGNQLCLLNTDISNKKYYQDSEKNDYYFPCSESLEHCDICEDKSTCTTCETDYIIEEASNHCISKTLYDEKKYYKNVATGKYVSCSNISGCEKCISATKCILCSSNLFLVKEDENIDSLTCKDTNENQYYQVTEDDITFYKKCMSHCEECTALDHCTKCEDNYAIIEDDHTVCEDLLTQKYYYDTQTTKYKLCSTYSNTCQKCQMDEGNNFICLECISTDYAFKHADNVECSLKSELKEDNTFYTNDTEINYYSCLLFNNAKKCLKCSNKEICDECQETYQLVNDKKLCVLPTDEEDNLVYRDPNTNYLVYCSDSISECNKCQNGETCNECKENSALVDSNKCLPEEEVTNNEHYFKDETTNGYISCSIINNCITCASSTVCTSCAQGYNINNNICQKIGDDDDDDDDDNSLSTGGIIGIVFGCLGFLLLVLLTIYFFMKKILKKNNPTVEIIDNEKQTDKISESEKPNDVENEKKDEIAETDKVNENEVKIHKGKRSIHN